MSVDVQLDPALLGLGLTYTISLAGMFQYCVRQSTEVENIVSLAHSYVFREEFILRNKCIIDDFNRESHVLHSSRARSFP